MSPIKLLGAAIRKALTLRDEDGKAELLIFCKKGEKTQAHITNELLKPSDYGKPSAVGQLASALIVFHYLLWYADQGFRNVTSLTCISKLREVAQLLSQQIDGAKVKDLGMVAVMQHACYLQACLVAFARPGLRFRPDPKPDRRTDRAATGETPLPAWERLTQGNAAAARNEISAGGADGWCGEGCSPCSQHDIGGLLEDAAAMLAVLSSWAECQCTHLDKRTADKFPAVPEGNCMVLRDLRGVLDETYMALERLHQALSSLHQPPAKPTLERASKLACDERKLFTSTLQACLATGKEGRLCKGYLQYVLKEIPKLTPMDKLFCTRLPQLIERWNEEATAKACAMAAPTLPAGVGPPAVSRRPAGVLLQPRSAAEPMSVVAPGSSPGCVGQAAWQPLVTGCAVQGQTGSVAAAARPISGSAAGSPLAGGAPAPTSASVWHQAATQAPLAGQHSGDAAAEVCADASMAKAIDGMPRDSGISIQVDCRPTSSASLPHTASVQAAVAPHQLSQRPSHVCAQQAERPPVMPSLCDSGTSSRRSSCGGPQLSGLHARIICAPRLLPGIATSSPCPSAPATPPRPNTALAPNYTGTPSASAPRGSMPGTLSWHALGRSSSQLRASEPGGAGQLPGRSSTTATAELPPGASRPQQEQQLRPLFGSMASGRGARLFGPSVSMNGRMDPLLTSTRSNAEPDNCRS